MRALKYSVEIQDDPVHSYTRRTIQEVWLPKINACFNEEGVAFESQSPRVPEVECEPIEIPPYWFDDVEKYLRKKSQIKSFCKEIFLTTKE